MSTTTSISNNCNINTDTINSIQFSNYNYNNNDIADEVDLNASKMQKHIDDEVNILNLDDNIKKKFYELFKIIRHKDINKQNECEDKFEINSENYKIRVYNITKKKLILGPYNNSSYNDTRRRNESKYKMMAIKELAEYKNRQCELQKKFLYYQLNLDKVNEANFLKNLESDIDKFIIENRNKFIENKQKAINNMANSINQINDLYKYLSSINNINEINSTNIYDDNLNCYINLSEDTKKIIKLNKILFNFNEKKKKKIKNCRV